jgi:Phage tail lysozyme
VANKDYIQEYLIGLGFDVPPEKLRKFREGAATAAKEVTELGGAALATATAIGYMTTQAARQFEVLYYQSQRTGVSVTRLKAFEFASRQVGVAAEEASGATEAMFATMRTNPGMQGLAATLGVNAAGGPLQLVQSLKKRFGEGQYFVAAAFADKFGIPEQTFRQYWTNLERTIEEQNKWEASLRAAGLSGPQVNENFLQLSRQVSAIEDHFAIAGAVIAKDFLPILEKIAPEVENIVTSFAKADAESGGSLGVAAGAATAGLPLLLLKSVRRFAGRLLGKGTGGVGAALEVMEMMKEDSQNGNKVRSMLRSALGIEDPGEAASWAGAKPGKIGSASSIVDYFVSQGWSREQAAGIAANLLRESGFNSGSSGDHGQAFGIAQWHPDRQADFKEKFGHDIRESTLEEQLAFVQHELTNGNEQFAGAKLRQARTAQEAGATVSQYYERPGVAGEAARRAQLADQLLGGGGTGNGGNVIDPHILEGRRRQAEALAATRQALLPLRDKIPNFDAVLGPAPSTVASAAPVINHDTDINIYGNVDQTAQQAIVKPILRAFMLPYTMSFPRGHRN